MLTSIEGAYHNGHIELSEPAGSVPEGTPVIVTFMDSGGFDLKAKGITQTDAAELRAALKTFEDWNEPDMGIYDDCYQTRSMP